MRASVALAVTGAGRVCVTSASSDPSVTTSSTPRSVARPVTSEQNVRQRRLGSLPSSSTTSCGPVERRAEWNTFSGQSIRRVVPSTSETCGRLEPKSKNSSGSISANFSASHVLARNVPASEAPWPPSFQPRNDAISTGRRSSGIDSTRSSRVGLPHRTILLPARGRQTTATSSTVAAQSSAASVTWMSTIHHSMSMRYWISPTAIWPSEHGEDRQREQDVPAAAICEPADRAPPARCRTPPSRGRAPTSPDRTRRACGSACRRSCRGSGRRRSRTCRSRRGRRRRRRRAAPAAGGVTAPRRRGRSRLRAPRSRRPPAGRSRAGSATARATGSGRSRR